MGNQNRESWLATVQQHRAIAVIRTLDPKLGIQLATAVARGGMRLIEITWNSEQPATLLANLRQELPNCEIGAGTILDRDQLDAAIAAGATFVFTPHVDAGLIQQAIAYDIPIIPGALSPTEIVQAWQAGASSVKVFPISALGGVAYIRSLQAPLGHIPLIPTGGVTLENAPTLIAAGAVAVGLASTLFPDKWVRQSNWSAIANQAAQLLDRLNAVSV